MYPRRYTKRRRSSQWSSAGGGVPRFRSIVSRSANRNVTRVTQTVEKLNVSLGVGGSYFAAVNFQLSDIANVSQFQTVFDEYRITAVKLTCSFGTVVNFAPTATTIVECPIFISAIDTDDSSTPTYANLLSHDTCLIHGSTTRSFTRWLRPEVALAAYQGTFAGYGSKANQWIDTQSVNVQHYGFKLGLINVQASTSDHMIIHATYYIEFRKAV